MILKIGDQLILRPGEPGEQIGQVIYIIGTNKFYNDTEELNYMIKTMKDGDVIFTVSQIRESDNIKFYKPKEDRDFDVLEKYKSIFQKADSHSYKG